MKRVHEERNLDMPGRNAAHEGSRELTEQELAG
jgi:hypothetical protein